MSRVEQVTECCDCPCISTDGVYGAHCNLTNTHLVWDFDADPERYAMPANCPLKTGPVTLHLVTYQPEET